MASLNEQLRMATRNQHAELEALPFFKALADGSLPIDSYLNQLRAFAVLFSTLERSAATVEDDSVGNMLHALDGRYAQLLQDLDVFGDLLLPDILPAATLSLELAHAVRQAVTENPRLLVGHLYALGGTILGNRVHLPDVCRLLDTHGEGGAFYAGFGDRTDEVWHGLVVLLDAFAAGEEEQRLIVETAQETFRGLIAIHAVLYPLPGAQGRRLTATALNPEAGSHPIPDDMREVSAALAAGIRCREEFPYFDARYGERGRRYTSSDVAWLATLCQLESDGIVHQVTWLADLLARRGMPRILLERQLELLIEELVIKVPERRTQYEKLWLGVEALRRDRLSHLSEQQFTDLAIEMETRLAPYNPKVPNLGVLIVSSLADEKCGIQESAASLETWLTGPGTFPSGMIAAVREALVKTRARLTP
jgi:heme oxygenase